MKPFRWSLVGRALAALAMSAGCGGGNEGTFEESTAKATGPTTVAPDRPTSYQQYQQQGGGGGGGGGQPQYPSNYGR